MFGCNQDVTIWNRLPDETFRRAVIPVKVRWKQKFKRETSGFVEATGTITTVIIPYTNNFKPYDKWSKMSESKRRRHKYFTIRPGDYIALGIHNDEITGEAPNRENDLFERLKPDCVQIKAVLDAIGPMARHFKVEGV